MKIELIDNVFETDRHGNNVGLKVTIKKRLKQVDAIIDGQPRKALVPDDLVLPWTKGTVHEVSDPTGQKLIERNQAKLYEEKTNDSSDSLQTESADTAED